MKVQARAMAVLALAMCLSAPLQAEDPTVMARILQVDKGFENYMPLAEATVTILADGERFTVKTLEADSDGYISFDVQLSTPFSLVFRGGGDRVPQMTSLAGERDSKNLIHVCLLTIKQHYVRYGGASSEKTTSEIDAMLLEIKRVRNATDKTNDALDVLEKDLKTARNRAG